MIRRYLIGRKSLWRILVFVFVVVFVVMTETAVAAAATTGKEKKDPTRRRRRTAPVQSEQQKVFETFDELQTAVDAFLLSVVRYDTNDDDDYNNDDEEEVSPNAALQVIYQQYGTTINDWNVSKLRHFNHLFDVDRNPLASSTRLQDTDFFDLSKWDVSQATSMIGIFRGATSMNVDVSHWDTSSNQRFDNMFQNARSFQGVGLNNWNVSNGINFESMFEGTNNLGASIDLRSWDVSKAETVTNMFRQSNFGRLDAPQQEQRRGQDFAITTTTTTTDDDDDEDDFELSDDDLFLFQNDIQQYNLCGWRWKLPASADTRGMFEQSLCPDTSDPDLTTTTRSNTIERKDDGTVTVIPATSFCVYCEEEIKIFNESNDDNLSDSESNSDSDSSDPDNEKSNDRSQEEEIKVEEEQQPGSSSSSSKQQQSTRKRPNVLFIIADQMRFDMIRAVQEEFYDHYQEYNNNKPFYKIQTPNLDKLKASGVYFKNAYCQCAVCGPSRTSLRTGCTIERTGIQHNDMITEFDNQNYQSNEHLNHMSFEERVQKLVSLDQLLVEQYGYVSEYYGKWHMPKSLGTASKTSSTSSSDNNSQYLNQYNDYNFETEEFFYDHDSSSSKKLRDYLNYYERQNSTISRTPIPDGMQRDTYTRAQYTPIQLDPRYDKPTDTPDTSPLIGNSKRRTQSNIMGRYGLSELYTPSYFTGLLSTRAIQRLIRTQQQEQQQKRPLNAQKEERGTQEPQEEPKPWFLTVSFHRYVLDLSTRTLSLSVAPSLSLIIDII